MDSSSKQTDLLVLLRTQLSSARENDRVIRAHNAAGHKIKIPNAGKILSSAYEQLRNAAEYAEDHLILQRAIRRFLKRNIFISGRVAYHEIGEDLIIELLQAGYLKQSDFGDRVSTHIGQLVKDSDEVYHRLRQSGVSKSQAQDWILSTLSVEIESLLNPQSHRLAMTYISHKHFLSLLPRKKIVISQAEDAEYEMSLYVAVHLALFKSDNPTIRHDLLRIYQQTTDDINSYIAINRHIDEIVSSRLTNSLRRVVSKNGAPLRILKSMCRDYPNAVDMLDNREEFLMAYRHQIDVEFVNVQRRVTKGIIKSIFFILITKVIIGIGIEVPYDLISTGAVATVPLIVNLATPPLYMASLKFSIKSPRSLSKQSLLNYIDEAIYGSGKPPVLMPKNTASKSILMTSTYTVMFFVPFAILVYVIGLLHFTILQMIIFFVFLSTASFLGFRLGAKVRELEFGERQSTGIFASLRDFFYLPFIIFGQWISGKYSRLNIVSNLLDILIELPLKTILKLIRQWVSFLDAKQEEIY